MQWFKNLRIFRLASTFSMSAEKLHDTLEKQAFQPCGSQDPSSMGRVPPREDGLLAYGQDGQLLIYYRAEKKI